MAPQKLTFTPKSSSANHHPTTMVLLVDPGMFDKYVAGDKSIPLSSIVDSFEVFKFEKPGREGALAKPSKSELQGCFGTTNNTEIVEFMVNHGEVHGKSRTGKKEKAATSHVETLLNADRRAY